MVSWIWECLESSLEDTSQWPETEGAPGFRQNTLRSPQTTGYWPTSLSHEYHKFLVANTNTTGYSVATPQTLTYKMPE